MDDRFLNLPALSRSSGDGGIVADPCSGNPMRRDPEAGRAWTLHRAFWHL